MKGIIHQIFNQYIEDEFGLTELNSILDCIESPSLGAYTTLETYDDNEVIQLLYVIEKRHKITPEDTLFKFGFYFFKVLRMEYGHHFNKSNMNSFLKYLNNYIHPEVESTMQGAITPTFLIEDCDNGFLLHYSSKRGMHSFAHGLLVSCNEYFDNEYRVEKLDFDSVKATFLFQKHG